MLSRQFKQTADNVYRVNADKTMISRKRPKAKRGGLAFQIKIKISYVLFNLVCTIIVEMQILLLSPSTIDGTTMDEGAILKDLVESQDSWVSISCTYCILD